MPATEPDLQSSSRKKAKKGARERQPHDVRLVRVILGSPSLIQMLFSARSILSQNTGLQHLGGHIALAPQELYVGKVGSIRNRVSFLN